MRLSHDDRSPATRFRSLSFCFRNESMRDRSSCAAVRRCRSCFTRLVSSDTARRCYDQVSERNARSRSSPRTRTSLHQCLRAPAPPCVSPAPPHAVFLLPPRVVVAPPPSPRAVCYVLRSPTRTRFSSSAALDSLA